MERIKVELTDKSFNDALQYDDSMVVMFEGSWCPVCKQFESLVYKTLEQYQKLNLYLLNIDKYKKTAVRYHVMGTPTFILFKDKREQKRYVGAITNKCFQSLMEAIT